MKGKPGRRYGESETFWNLVHNGPQLGVEISDISPTSRRVYDIRKFNNSTIFPRTKIVYYLNEYHNPEDVLRVWIQGNERILKTHDSFYKDSISRGTEGKFSDAWENLKQEYEWIESKESNSDSGTGGSGSVKVGTKCPFCGENISKSLPFHIRNSDCSSE